MTTRLLRSAVLTLTVAHAARGQRVFGTVVGADSTTPVAGAIVVARDTSGAAVARELSSPRGAFTLVLPAAGAYDVQVLRLGAQPLELGVVALQANEDHRLKIVFAAAPVRIDARARGAETCRPARDTGSAVAHAWDQARTALTIMSMAIASRSMVGTWHRYEREVDRNLKDTISRKDDTDRADIDEQFWPTLPPDSAAAVGYTIEGEKGVTYYAPSIATLLSNAFRDHHCFRLDPATDGSQALIGVHFRPEGDRPGVNEIEGTWWMDRATLEPRELRFAFTNMPPAFVPARPGGFMRFVRATTGDLILGEWEMHVPAGVFRRLWAYRSGHAASFATRLLLEGVRVAGGRLDVLERGSQVVYRREDSRE